MLLSFKLNQLLKRKLQLKQLLKLPPSNLNLLIHAQKAIKEMHAEPLIRNSLSQLLRNKLPPLLPLLLLLAPQMVWLKINDLFC